MEIRGGARRLTTLVVAAVAPLVIAYAPAMAAEQTPVTTGKPAASPAEQPGPDVSDADGSAIWVDIGVTVGGVVALTAVGVFRHRARKSRA
jgi:hypothetical protein